MPWWAPVGRSVGHLTLLLLVSSTTTRAGNEELRLPPPTYEAATAAWHAGRPADALQALDRALETEEPANEAGLEALVLRATLLTELGRPEEAEALWQEVIAREVWMRTFARRALVEIMIDRAVPTEAETVLDELTGTDPVRHLDLALRVADAYRATGETTAARRVYRRVLRVQSRSQTADAARLGTALTWRDDDDIAAALSQLREAKLLHWRADTFEDAVRLERELLEGRTDRRDPFTDAQYRTLVRRLRNASRYEPALDLIDEWRASRTTTGTPSIEAERIATLYAQRANEAAVAACQVFYEQYPEHPLVPEIRLTDFRLAVRMVDTPRARRTGRDLWEGRVRGATPTHRRDAAVLLAAYLVAVGDIDGGLELYRELFQSSESADDQRAFLWRAGVAALKDGQPERALTNFQGLLSRNPTGDLAPAGLYWRGVAEAETDPGASRQTLEAVAKRFPFHYYGMRARERLDAAPDPADVARLDAPLTFPELSVDPSTPGRAEYRAAMLLARAGRVSDAAWYLQRLLTQRRQDRGLALLAARASAEAGDYASVARVLVNHFVTFLQRPAFGLPDDFWRLVYPRPFWPEVNAAGRAQGVDPLLLLSLMRQESRFDPAARSPVGAIGLFQIMPYTAEALADRAGVGHVAAGGRLDVAVLAQPAVNSAIAARLAADLLEMFEGSMAPVVASYNAGEDRVAVWWAASRDLTEDLFVDTIPYSETRRFVREVLANRAAYERIYGDQ